jgi:hypothetical protein
MRRYPLFFYILLLFSFSAHGQARLIFTLAGDGVPGFSGDGGTAPAAELSGPLGVAVDSAGNVYIEDYYNNRVRKVAQNGFAGTITTVAGSGTPGYTGDGSIATNAEIIPHGLALDRYANLYISDENVSVIRKVNAKTQIITTVAGNGTWGYSGDGGQAKYAQLKEPYGMAVDLKGNLYIADAGNMVIRKVDTAGIITTYAGIGDSAGFSGDNAQADSAKLDSPYAVAVDRWGALYITDYVNQVIRKVDTFQNISEFAGTIGVNGYSGDGGAATAATLNNPKGIAVDTFGNVYIADADNNVIRMVNTAGVITTVAGNGSAGFGGDLGPALGCNLHNPYGIAVDVYGNLIIADANNQRVRETYNPYLAVSNVVSNRSPEVYPNPFSDNITVTGCSKSDRVSICDITGRQVSEIWTIETESPQTFDIGNLSPGIYMLQVRDSNGNKTAIVKIVKE